MSKCRTSPIPVWQGARQRAGACQAHSSSTKVASRGTVRPVRPVYPVRFGLSVLSSTGHEADRAEQSLTWVLQGICFCVVYACMQVCTYYVAQAKAVHHGVREAACACIAELAEKVQYDALSHASPAYMLPITRLCMYYASVYTCLCVRVVSWKGVISVIHGIQVLLP